MSYTKKASITIDNTKVSGKRPLGQTSLIDDANLVSYWPLDGNSNDEAGSNNGTDTDIAYSNSYGRFVEGADFDGTGDNIVVGTTGIPSGNSNFTWVFWMHPDGFPSGNILWYANSGNSLEKIGIQLTNGGNVRAWVGGGTEIDSTDSLNDGEWNLVMIGYDGGATNKWYFGVNGNYESKNTGQNDLSLGFSSKAPAWGYGDGAFGNDGDFQLDELACFSKVLSQSEYEELWENTSHSNFPVLISGTYDGTGGEPDIRTTGNGGNVENTDTGGASGSLTVPADLDFFSDSELTTGLDFEIEYYNASTGEIVAWVEIGTLDIDADTVIYMGYGDSGVTTSQENVTGTWNANYEAVWHMSQYNTVYDSNWDYQEELSVNNSGSSLSNHQVKYTVDYKPGMESNFDDIRFCDSGGNDYDYWIQEKTDGSSAVVWIKLDSIPNGSSTLYLIYGNSNASTTSTTSVMEYYKGSASNDLYSQNNVDSYSPIVCAHGNEDFTYRINFAAGDYVLGFRARIGSNACSSTLDQQYTFDASSSNFTTVPDWNVFEKTETSVSSGNHDINFDVINAGSFNAGVCDDNFFFDWLYVRSYTASQPTISIAAQTLYDSTSNNNGTSNGNPIYSQTGQIGSAIDFDGTGDYIDIPSPSISLSNKVTVSAWIYGDIADQPQNDTLFEGENSSSNRELNVHLPWSNGSIYWDAGYSGGFDRINKSASASDYEGSWLFYNFTKNATSGSMKIYQNTTEWHSGSGKTNSFGTITDFTIGSAVGGTSNYSGMIDEFRITSVERSSDWIATEYNNQSSPPTFYTMGSEETAVVRRIFNIS